MTKAPGSAGGYLLCGDNTFEHDGDCSDVDEAYEVDEQLVVMLGDLSQRFDLVEKSFNDIEFFVERLVVEHFLT